MAVCGKKCAVWQRVVGYYRPVRLWNRGKQEEHRQRVAFVLPKVKLKPSKRKGK